MLPCGTTLEDEGSPLTGFGSTSCSEGRLSSGFDESGCAATDLLVVAGSFLTIPFSTDSDVRSSILSSLIVSKGPLRVPILEDG